MKPRPRKPVPPVLDSKDINVYHCMRCGLSSIRRTVVLGRGSLPCDILFIGDAPGTSEDLLGEPFVGVIGKVFDLLLQQSRVIYEAKYYVTNCVLCRPADQFGGMSREPKPEEILACMPNVKDIIQNAKPIQVVLVGSISDKYYSKEFPHAIRIHHPAFLIKTGGAASPHWLENVKKLEKVLSLVKKGRN